MDDSPSWPYAATFYVTHGPNVSEEDFYDWFRALMMLDRLLPENGPMIWGCYRTIRNHIEPRDF